MDLTVPQARHVFCIGLGGFNIFCETFVREEIQMNMSKRKFFWALSILTSLDLIAIIYYLQMPNLTIFLILPVLLFAYTGGYIGGMLSAGLSILCSFYFFSEPGALFCSTEKLLTMSAVMLVVVVLVGRLEQRDAKRFKEKEEHVRGMTRINSDLNKSLIVAQNANEAQSFFFSNLSNDTRTPINAIIELSRTSQAKTKDPKAMADCLNKIESVGKFLWTMSEDFSDISKLEKGNIEFELEKYSFQEFKSEIKVLLNPLLEQKNLALIFDIDSKSFPSVMVDKIRFKQLFFNLLSNSIKLTPQYGEVFLTINKLSEKMGCLSCEIIVANIGMGTSDSLQETTSQPFTQEFNHYSAECKASSLGLPIVKNIIDAMNGTITVRRCNNETSFKIILDLRVANEINSSFAENKNIQQKETFLKGKRILLAEDNPINKEIAEFLLEKEGAQVICAENGQKAVDLFTSSTYGYYDAVIMDIQMPQMDGLEATQLIRNMERDDARYIPIIALTTNAFDEDVKKSIASGMDHHLTKPIQPVKLYETLASFL